MGAALRKAKQHGRTTVQIVLERQDDGLAGVLPGSPAEHTPPLTGDDIVFAEGGPRMMESARDRAEAAGHVSAPISFRRPHLRHPLCRAN